MSIERNKLNPLRIKALTEPGLYHDGRGLYLRIGPSGAKSWIFRYMIDGKRHDLGMGTIYDTTLAEARDEAAIIVERCGARYRSARCQAYSDGRASRCCGSQRHLRAGGGSVHPGAPSRLEERD